MMKWLVKKWICRNVNKTLKKYSGRVDIIRYIMGKWARRLENIISCLRQFLSRIEDGELDARELDDTSKAVQELVKTW